MPDLTEADGATPLGDAFVSTAQQAYLEIHKPEVAKEFESKTSKKDYEEMPEHVKDGDDPKSQEILAPFPYESLVLPISAIKLHPSMPIHANPEDANDAKDDAEVETYDIDKKVFKVWEPLESPGLYYLIDGHHHYKQALMATHFVSSKTQDGRFVAAKPEVFCRCYKESDGWTLPLIQRLSYAMNFPDKKALTATVEPFTEKTLSDGQFEFIDFGTSSIELLCDQCEPGVLMRVRQCITRADTPTKWGYRYRRAVLQDAIEEARKRVKLGLVISERHHPAVLNKACDHSGCGPKFADNYDAKTARVEAISDVGPDGRVFATRAILDTEQGRIVADLIRAGNDPVSVRWALPGDIALVDGYREPSKLTLVTLDDVDNPAMAGAGQVVAIMDSIDLMTDPRPKDSKSPDGLGDPFQGVNRNTVNPTELSPGEMVARDLDNAEMSAINDAAERPGAHSATRNNNMEAQEIRAQIRALSSLVRKGAPVNQCKTAHQLVADSLVAAYNEGHVLNDFMAEYKAVLDAADGAGYQPGKEAPHIYLANELGEAMFGGTILGGWGPDMRQTKDGAKKGQQRQLAQRPDLTPHELNKKDEVKADGDDDQEDKDKDEAKKKRKEIKAKMDSLVSGGHPISRLPELVQDSTLRTILRTAASADEAAQMLSDAVINWNAAQTPDALKKLGFKEQQLPSLGVVVDTAMPFNSGFSEGRPDQAALDKLFLATDDFIRSQAPAQYNDGIRPGHPETEQLRKYNRPIANKILDEYDKRLEDKMGKDVFWGRLLADSASDPITQISHQVDSILHTDSYTTAIAQLPNQPTVFRWIGVQAFQDMRGLQFCAAMGPGQDNGGTGGWEFSSGFGRVFKIVYETYIDPPGYGAQYGTFDAGLLTPENTEIPEGTIGEYWDTIGPLWRFNATSATIQGLKSLGNGPLNLSVMARNLWHASARKSRSIDLAISNEMVDICLEYGATAVTNEAYTALNNGLGNQTVYQNGSNTVPGATTTSVVVNLNPTKAANAAVATSSGVPSDDFAVYPVPGVTPGAGGILPVAGLRLLGGAAVNSTSPFFGTNKSTRNPIVRPRTLLTLTSAGADSNSTLNAFSITVPAAMVQGYLGNDGYIYANAPNVTPTFAVDWTRGVVVFASGAVTNNAGVIGTNVTVANYSYSTNFDPFPLTPGVNAMATTVTGETPQAFYSRLVGQLDFTAANMSMFPRFVAPDLAISSPYLAAFLLQATIFYKLNSPTMSDLYPSEDFYARRNGIDMARLNAPLYMGNDMVVLTRRFTSKYAVDTPWEIRGPLAKYGTAGNFMAGEGFMGWENSAIFTTQVKNTAGTIINPVARGILCIGAPQV